jgi:hypothetical protein
MPEPVGARLAWARRRAGAQARRRAGAQTSEKRGSDIRAEQEVVSLWCAPQMRPAPEQSSARDSQGAIRFAPSARGSSLRTHRRRRQQNIEAIQDGVPTPFSLENTKGRENLSPTMQALQVPPSPLVSWRFVRGDCSVRTATRRRRTHRGNIMIFLAGLNHTSRPMRPGSSRMCLGHILNRRLSGRRGLWREIVRGRVIAGGSVTTHASSCS